MRAILNGTIVFVEQQMQVGSWRRERIERSVGGLNGVVSIDSGMRSRRLIQTGVLRAVSDDGLSGKIEAVSELLDSKAYTLVVGGEQFENLRVDSFETGKKDYSGRGVGCEFEIRYTQLRAD